MTLLSSLFNHLFLWVLLIFFPKTTVSSFLPFLSSLQTPTDYIDCSQPCDGGDVNHILTASIRTFSLILGNITYQYRGRTYSSPNSPNFLGPTIHVQPGESLHIKLINNLTIPIGPNPPSPEDYWEMLNKPGEKIKYPRYKKRVSHPSQLKVDKPNMPHNFDHTNLHLHGLDVEVHMFDPVHTHNPYAEHIAVPPGGCYCYRFNIPADHPKGMYWYHPHLHGSTAIQMWSGMIGVLYVGKDDIEEELNSFNIVNSKEFIIWDPAFKAVEGKSTHNLEVDEFLLGQTTLSKIHPFLVNGEINPIFETKVGQVLHLHTLCATVENENTFIIYPEGNQHIHWEEEEAGVIPFWLIGSDGVMYPRPIKKSILVMSGGQREEILIQIDQPGRYVISQQGIQGMQFFDMMGHPHDQIIATIVVTDDVTAEEDEDVVTKLHPTIPIEEMTFKPGYGEEESIKAEDINGAETIIFSMGANFDQVPFPQYYVNGQPFSPNQIQFHAQPGEAREYTLINANHNAHPFHMHVNRFQIQEMGSELSTETYPALKSVLDFEKGAWRDTVMVPPNGRTRIWVQFKNYTGKTVVHCHFLAHEDTGMMATLFIGKKDWVFRLEENLQLIVGILVGVLVSCVITFVYYISRRRRGGGGWHDPSSSYSILSMNEIKSKTLD